MNINDNWTYSELGKEAFNASRPFSFKLHPYVVFVNTGDVLQGEFLHSKISEGAGLPGQAKKALKPDDILLTEIRPSNGRYAYVDFNAENYVVSTKFMVIESYGRLKPRFLYHVLTNQFALNEFQRIAESRSGTFPQITFDSIEHFPVPVPPMSAQEALIEFFDEIDGRATLLRETNATLEAIAGAIFKSWFVDFDPVRASAEGKVFEGIDEVTAALFPRTFQESELGLIPDGWQTDSLENWLAVLETGRRPKGGVAGIDFGIPSIGAESVIKIGEFDYSKLKFVSSDFFQKMKSGKLESRDVLLYKDGGKPGVFLPRVSMFGDGFPFETCGINEHVFRMRLKAPFGQTFLYFWLWSDAVMHELKHRGGKAAIPGINQGDVKELRIAVPSVPVLTAFDSITSPLISKILTNAKALKSLQDLRNTLLPRLISGQLRIADVEAELEKATA